jgi:NAD(P)H dehydrogenase (quinone)
MTTLVIAYHSEAGHTRKLAQFIAGGVAETGVRARLIEVADITEADWAALRGADGIVFGTPTFMGGISARFKAFMDATSDFWDDRSHWGDKIAGGFTIGSRFSGDKLATLQGLSIFAAQHAMIWVGQEIGGTRGIPGEERQPNGDGSWLGLMATASPDKAQKVFPADAETARAFGIRLAEAARRWQG